MISLNLSKKLPILIFVTHLPSSNIYSYVIISTLSTLPTIVHNIKQVILFKPHQLHLGLYLIFIEYKICLLYTSSNKVDITLANFTVTDERKKQVDFALPYMKVSLGVVSPKTGLITDVKQLEGKTLIVTKGTTAETYFEKNHPEIKLQKYDQYSCLLYTSNIIINNKQNIVFFTKIL